MRRTHACILLLALVPLTTGQATPAPTIAEIHPDPDGGREFVELHNPATDAIDLEGWRVEDSVGNGHTFAARTLAPGDRVVLWSGGADDALGPAMGGSTVWNNGGDTVFLFDPAGTLVESVSYGTAEVPAPARGQSLHRTEAGWTEAAPSPGGGPGEQVGTATATVEDVSPEAAFESVPARLRPGEAGVVTVRVDDPNGAADLSSWSLSHGTTLLADGTTAGSHDAIVSFTDPGDIILTLRAEDAAGQATEATATLVVAEDHLVVTLPTGGLAFPPLPPGGGPVDASAVFLLRNDGAGTATPRIDISDLEGPGTIPVAGHLHVGTRTEPTADWTWTPYDAPLTGLPALAPGAEAEVLFRLLDIPDPLPAGDYHTSFTVIA